MAFNQSLLHVRRPLTDLVVSYDATAEGFLRTKFFPRKEVPNLTNQIRQISKPDLLRLYDTPSASDSNVAEVQFRLDSTLSYSCQAFAVSAALDDLDAKNADGELIYEQRQAMQLNAAMMLRMEYLALNQNLRSTAVMTTNTTLSAAQRWDNYTSTSSSPLDDLLVAKVNIESATGKDINVLAMSNWTWKALKQHPNVLSRMPVHTTGPTGAILTKKILAEILEMDESGIHIYNKTYNSAKQGETAAYKNFLGSDVVMAHLEAPSLYAFGLGHEFSFSGFGSDPLAVIRYRDEKRGALGADIIKVVSMVDFKVLVPTAGYLIKTALDTTNSAYGGFVD